MNDGTHRDRARCVADWILTMQDERGGFSNFKDMDGSIRPLQSDRAYAPSAAGSADCSWTSYSQRGGYLNILPMTSPAFVSKHRPWLSKIRCGCHEWIFPMAAFAFRGWRSSGNRMPKKI